MEIVYRPIGVVHSPIEVPVSSHATELQTSGRALLRACLIVLSAHACSSASVDLAGARDWSRSYVLPYDRVWSAAVMSLPRIDFWIEESDHERGLIRAESTREPSYRAVVLVVRIDQRDEQVRVDVQASGGNSSSAGIGELDRVVNEFLNELDERLRQR